MIGLAYVLVSFFGIRTNVVGQDMEQTLENDDNILVNNGRLNFLLCLLKLSPARLLDILHLLLTNILLRNLNYILFSCLLQAVTLKTKKTILIRLLAENGLFRVKILFYKLFNLSSFSDTVS